MDNTSTRLIIGILLILIILMVGSMIVAARAEAIEPHIVYTRYDGHELIGLAEVPDAGDWWARITMYLDDDSYIILFAPIMEDGSYQAWIWSWCRYITVGVVPYPIRYEVPDGCTEIWPTLAWE